MTARPLDGVRVVEVAGWMAAPGATALMADLGADVVKVEPLTGDVARGAVRQPDGIDLDASFQADNRGKRGIAVALDRPEGRELVRRLTERVDVFVTNLLGHRQRKFGLDPETLLQANPRLVHATLTGYGVSGPDAARAGYDITAFFGRGGITHSITEPGDHAPRSRPAQGDHTAALALLAGVLSALRLVERTGQGQVVDCSLLATAAWTMTTDLSATLVDGQNPITRGRRHRRYALQESFRTADDRFFLLFMPEPRWWPRFCEAVGRPEWVSDPRFESHAARGEHMPELTSLMDALFAQRTLAEWGELFEQHGFIWAPAATVAELAADPHADAVGMFPAIEHPTAGTVRTVGAPFGIRGADVAPRGPAPALGAHTAQVLAQAGLSEDDVRALVEQGVVGQG
ncbi:MAG TPA: CoA transferase [Mycobacteriales bacterium]|nr:CoA transferase [Mycobacteriales bacterium]